MLTTLVRKLRVGGAVAAVSAFCLVFSISVGAIVFRAFDLPNIQYMLFVCAVCPLVLSTPISYCLFRRIKYDDMKRMELEEAKHMLEKSLSRVKQLSGLIAQCSLCKKIRDDAGYWSQIEAYISQHSQVEFTQHLCPDCTKTYYKKWSKAFPADVSSTVE